MVYVVGELSKESGKSNEDGYSVTRKPDKDNPDVVLEKRPSIITSVSSGRLARAFKQYICQSVVLRLPQTAVTMNAVLTTIVLSTIIFIFLSWFIRHYGPGSNYRCGKILPPRPPVLPIIGNLHMIWSRNGWQDLKNIANRYGNVYRLQLGTKEVVVLNGYDAIKQALLRQNESFNERPVNIQAEFLGNQGRGVGHAGGIHWREHRKFTNVLIHEFGWGKPEDFHKLIQTEVKCVMKELIDTKKGESCDPSILYHHAVYNIQCQFIFGKRFDYNDKKAIQFFDALRGFALDTNPAVVMTIFPLLAKIPLGSTKRLLSHVFVARTFIRGQIENKLALRKKLGNTYKPARKNYIDCYLDEIEARRDQPELEFSNDSLILSILDIFFGNQALGDVLAWTTLMMVSHPEVQKKVQTELDRVIGPDRHLDVNDKYNLHYLNAVLFESIRIRPISPFGIPRITNEDTSICGFFIPKKTYVVPNLWSVQGDGKYWPNPMKFDPERNLDNNGVFTPQSRVHLLFGIGPRTCFGQKLANMEMLIFFENLLQRYNIHLIKDADIKHAIGGHLKLQSIVKICNFANNTVSNMVVGEHSDESGKINEDGYSVTSKPE
ncbi:cytochrome P450 2C20-like [Saccoglossus kowalevskii]|uniref:Cytochrome P450 2C11-like n=1 Tax=Saccoglossus kowalevskii TaxID=10224 RepID=A0ABM0GSB1_SACKO|nr:PREDICTED: cytochrome P450 2C11-like [Saccoglossus kowalevskii]